MAGVFDLEVAKALSLLPHVPAVMTSAFELKRAGMLVDRVMLCANEPPCVAVAVPKGHRLSTLIRDSHSFALNFVDPKQRLLIKKFECGSEGDAFDLLESRKIVTNAPCLARAQACLDCDVMRHFDLEADYEMYIGMVLGAWVPSAPTELAPFANGYSANGHGSVNGHSSKGRHSNGHHTNGHGTNGHADAIRASAGHAD